MRFAFRVRDWSLFGAGLLLGVLGASVLFGPPQMANETPPWDRSAQDGAASATHAAGAGPAAPLVSPPAAVFGPPAASAPVATAPATLTPIAPVTPAAPAQAAASQPAPALALAPAPVPAVTPPGAAASEPVAAKPETVAKVKPRHHEEKHESENLDALPPPEPLMQVNPDETRPRPNADEATTSDSFATVEPKPRHRHEQAATPDDATTSDAVHVPSDAPPRFAPEAAPPRFDTDSSPPAAATGEATGDAHASDSSQ